MAVTGLLPSFPAFGSVGNFSVSYAFAPLAGIMFGPFTGALSVAIGEFIGSIIAPHNTTLGIFTFIINTPNAFAAGYISRAVRTCWLELTRWMSDVKNLIPSVSMISFAVCSLISCMYLNCYLA